MEVSLVEEESLVGGEPIEEDLGEEEEFLVSKRENRLAPLGGRRDPQQD